MVLKVFQYFSYTSGSPKVLNFHKKDRWKNCGEGFNFLTALSCGERVGYNSLDPLAQISNQCCVVLLSEETTGVI